MHGGFGFGDRNEGVVALMDVAKVIFIFAKHFQKSKTDLKVDLTNF